MLLAHLVPGYFAAIQTEPHWSPAWSPRQRALLWTVALTTTFLPDIDQVVGQLVPQRADAATLWTHSVFPYLGMAVGWWFLRRARRWPLWQMLIGLTAVGGLSHLLLDVIAHGKVILYPLSSLTVGIPGMIIQPESTAKYMTSPMFLLEPLLLSVAAAHWIVHHRFPPRVTRPALQILLRSWAVFTVMYCWVISPLPSFPSQTPPGSFESGIDAPWQLWVDRSYGYEASVTRDTTVAAEGYASARIDVSRSRGADWQVDFYEADQILAQGATYTLTFWAKSNVARTITVSAQKNAPEWDNYGLWQQVTVGPGWELYMLTFRSAASAHDAAIQFGVGRSEGSVWLDDVRLTSPDSAEP